jgi:16S rRNA (guanine1207-N2)-methyltransferase
VASRDHYFSAEPATSSSRRCIDLILPDVRLRLSTDRGMFSPDRIDAGTKALLLDAPAPPHGAANLADVGCGYGPIALTLATRCPDATVWAVDVNRRALEVCRANADAAGLANVVVVAPGALPDGLTFDAAYSNPPIRIGKPALHALLLDWLGRLRRGGRLELVVHKHLGADSLQRWLVAEGWPTRRVASRAGYRLLEASAPGPRTDGPAANVHDDRVNADDAP